MVHQPIKSIVMTGLGDDWLELLPDGSVQWNTTHPDYAPQPAISTGDYQELKQDIEDILGIGIRHKQLLDILIRLDAGVAFHALEDWRQV